MPRYAFRFQGSRSILQLKKCDHSECVGWQIEQAQQTLSAIVAVSKNLHDLHQRLASSLMVSKSDSAMNYVVDGVEQHTAEVLTLLKRKEERLQIEVNKCAELRTENLMLTKQLQVSAAQLA